MTRNRYPTRRQICRIRNFKGKNSNLELLRKNEELAINEELDVCDPGARLSDAVREAGHLGFLKQKTRRKVWFG
jgi:hypothetical protein